MSPDPCAVCGAPAAIMVADALRRTVTHLCYAHEDETSGGAA